MSGFFCMWSIDLEWLSTQAPKGPTFCKRCSRQACQRISIESLKTNCFRAQLQSGDGIRGPESLASRN